jgi:uncharacterized protein (UPF0264 family)
MAGLLVSVRSADEALAAWRGGATVIDVKEPDRGPLGRADVSVWSAVRRVLPPAVSVSVALGELIDEGMENLDPRHFKGLAYRKIGLAGAGPDWERDWSALRRALGAGPTWVAVAYADWERASAPPPDSVLDAALRAGDCAGILVDTWDKRSASPVDASWEPWIARARRGGRFVALAGGLDEAAILRLAPLGPDLFAVRGAACAQGDRLGAIDPARVARLVRAARLTSLSGPQPCPQDDRRSEPEHSHHG